MKTTRLLLLTLTLATFLAGFAKTDRIKDGAYYGTNYTVPFAHAYRALDSLGVDHRRAIDRDVYHLGRMGLNAFRLHLWDVELSDSQGNLLANDHIDLLDYLIASLEKRGISVVLTAQTNFGNGYPERNTDPNGAYSYRYEKCKVHDDPNAQAAQAKYLSQLVRHVNKETGLSYADDPSILAIEINNEPCHSGSHKEITAYINSMVKSLRQAGWKKDILYNVSHNLWRTQAFYDARIDGTTYQWYPTGLVKGSRRRGNFLPVLDNYNIPFADTIRGFSRQPRVVYEYDPADVLDSYLYPAAARTFRKAGFNWITQFAYDPIDMARFNTEYQTHYLNLAYTPGKAIGMMIAAEATRSIPAGTDYGKYPADTVFGPFTVSARHDLATLNNGRLFYHTNNTDMAPADPLALERIAGVGSSPLVQTDGLGAYFIDRLGADAWRVEVMPDVLVTSDPFAKTSLRRTVARTFPDVPVNMTLNLPGLKGRLYCHRPGTETTVEASADNTVSLLPGVWIVSDNKATASSFSPDDTFGEGKRYRIGEYAMPEAPAEASMLLHTPALRIAEGDDLEIRATIAAASGIDSVVVYPSDVSFWSDNNRLYRMEKTGKYEYTTTVKAAELGKKGFRYNIVVYGENGAESYPRRLSGTPLDWDYPDSRSPGDYYWTVISGSDAPVQLFRPRADLDGMEISTIPEVWRGISLSNADRFPSAGDALRLTRLEGSERATMVLSKYVGDIMACHSDAAGKKSLCVRLGKVEGLDSIKAGLVTRDGFTYSLSVPVRSNSVAEFPLEKLALDKTLLNPAPYPSFLSREFVPDPSTATPFRVEDLETLTLVLDGNTPAASTTEIEAIWLN